MAWTFGSNTLNPGESQLHETGHTAFGFADEYCKWGNLIAAATPIPTTSNPDCTQCNNGANPVTAADTVGAFEGAGYYHCGLFRGQYACRMRALGNPYCAVCQQVIRQTLASFMPSWVYGTNTIGGGQTQDWWLWWPGYPGFEVIGV